MLRNEQVSKVTLEMNNWGSSDQVFDWIIKLMGGAVLFILTSLPLLYNNTSIICNLEKSENRCGIFGRFSMLQRAISDQWQSC